MNTATSEMLIVRTVIPDFRRALSALPETDSDLLQVACDVLDHDNRVIHHEPRRNRQRHEREIVHAEAEQVHHAESPDQRYRNRDARNETRPDVSQKYKTTRMTRITEMISVISTSCTEARMVTV